MSTQAFFKMVILLLMACYFGHQIHVLLSIMMEITYISSGGI